MKTKASKESEKLKKKPFEVEGVKQEKIQPKPKSGNSKAAGKRKRKYKKRSTAGSKTKRNYGNTNKKGANKSNADNIAEDHPEYIIKPDRYNAFARGCKPIKILNASNTTGRLIFLIQFERVNELIPATIANIKCPQLVIKFYEERIVWDSNDEDDECTLCSREI